MKAREKIEAEEKKIEIYNIRGATCEVCGKRVLYTEAQIAHRISKGQVKKYGKEIIHHPKNLVLTCSGKMGRCNDSINITNNPMEVLRIVKSIEEEIKE